ncbi:MAG TPA: dienelactone hydrolase family protein [Gaiellaceae bacterium]|nr:dienelactone hydrolase family protein [Gaiellaceae bacterium]
MCFELDSSPPVPAIAGAAVSHEHLELEAADGASFAAFHAAPDDPRGAGIVVLPDVRGLYRFYEELALRFAERGHPAVAIDYFGRTAGVARRGEDFPYREHVERTTPAGIQADVRAAVDYLRSPEGGARRAVVTVGFCFGGSSSWNAAAGGHGLAGAVGFYGRPSRVERLDALAAPILALMGGADPAIPLEEVEAFDRALDEAGVEHEVVVYDGAPHSFFDRRHDEFADASADAWKRVLAFVDRHAG